MQGEHSVVREGAVAGILGAVVSAAWFLVFDLAAGRPLHTANVLGKVLFAGDVNPGLRAISSQAVLGFTLLQVVTYIAAGIGLTALVHLVSRNPSLRMGLWIGLVVALGFFAGHLYMLVISSGERIPFWSVAGGSVLALGLIIWYLWRRHPGLGTSAPLGAEVKTTPHAPGAPGGATRR
jgi:hypothetical protein